MSLDTGSSNSSFSRNASFSSVSSTRISTKSSDVERMSECNFYRNLWWDKGEFSDKAKWEEVALPYVLATGVTIEEYEQRTEKFSIHGCWEWREEKVIIYEFPSAPHEVCIGAIVKEIIKRCSNIDGTNAEIISFGATRTRDINRGKEADSSFRPDKPLVTPPNGSDRNDFPWPNLVVEVAYSETLDHVEEALCYWLSPGRAHDCIIVKIDPVPQGEVPVRMRAWHYCVSDRRTRSNIPARTMFEFGTQNGTGAPLNILQGQCIINISLDCLYFDAEPTIQKPRDLLPDPITIDFFFVRHAFKEEKTEIPELREKLLRFAEVEAENVRLKQIIEENARRDAENAELKSRVRELETRLALLEQGSAVNGMTLSFGQTQNDEEKSNLIAKLDDTASYKMNSNNTPEQIENISNNISNSDVYQESNIQYSESLIHTESRSSKDKEIEFLDQVHKETVSIEIRERNRKKKLLQTNNTSISQAENLSSVNASKLPVIIKLDKNLITEQELKQQLSTSIPISIISDQIQDQDLSSVTTEIIEKIKLVSYNADAISSLSYQQIQNIIDYITENHEDFLHNQSHVTSKIHLTNTYIPLKAPQSKPTYDRSYFHSKTLDQYPNLYQEDHNDENDIKDKYEIGSYNLKCEQCGIKIKINSETFESSQIEKDAEKKTLFVSQINVLPILFKL
ncbi:14508_t:CDS:10 [Cetraspora pellucida]|uniref:14508_t:CDS:1 n=1 Tax=Cetraspora pellucida TaxID=1433469 RepID=A0A9N9DKH2_9GLOM|nr:14508_t:CDS:10 [Cetraspora pellucida]